MSKHVWLRPIVWWIYSALAVTGVFSAMYVSVQQDLRQGSNDPQIAMAEDAATQLEGGAVPASLVPRGVPLLDIKTTLNPWLAVYDTNALPLESSAQLSGAPPQPPKGLFDESTWVSHKLWKTPAGNETRVTWQPEPDVRQSIVLVHYKSATSEGFVVAGRSMRLTEERIIQLGINLLVAWVFTLGSLFGASFIGDWLLRKYF